MKYFVLRHWQSMREKLERQLRDSREDSWRSEQESWRCINKYHGRTDRVTSWAPVGAKQIFFGRVGFIQIQRETHLQQTGLPWLTFWAEIENVRNLFSVWVNWLRIFFNKKGINNQLSTIIYFWHMTFMYIKCHKLIKQKVQLMTFMLHVRFLGIMDWHFF